MIRSETDAGVCLLTFDRPEALNAFDPPQFDRLTDALLAAQDDPKVRLVVMTGAGRAFSAGADLRYKKSPDAVIRFGFKGFVDVVIDFPKPILLAINGIGVGIGATICGLADMVYMASSARLRCPFSALGITAEACSTYTFPLLMGPQRAARFLLGAQWLDAAACKEQGLAMEVLPDDGFLDAVMTEARELAKLPGVSLSTTHVLMRASHRDALKAANIAENEALAELHQGAANREAVNAFKEKREPDFSAVD